MTEQKCFVFRFADFEVREREFSVIRAGEPLQLEPKAFRVLQYLLHHPQELVTKDELLDAVWKDVAVTENSPARAVAQLRRVLGDDVREPRFIATVTTAGYRFVCPVQISEDGSFGLNGANTSPNPNSGGITAAEAKPERTAKPKVWRKPWVYGATLVSVAIVTVCSTVIWKAISPAPRAPKVLRFRKLTNDGQVKFGPMVTDGSRIYFNELLPYERNIILQVSVQGGEAVPISVPLKRPRVLDLSQDGAALLVANTEDDGVSLWIQPVAGGSPRRVGTILANDARFGPDVTSIIYGDEHDVYLVQRDGSSLRKLLSVNTIPLDFRFSPDSRVFRFTSLDNLTGNWTTMEATADGTGLHPLFRGGFGEWTLEGRFFLYLKKDNGRFDLWASPEKRSLGWRNQEMKPIRLTDGPMDFEWPWPGKDGKEVFAIGTTYRAEIIRYNSRTGEYVPYLNGISAEGLAFSPDGQWVVYTSIPEGILWRSRTDGSERLQLTFPPMQAQLPRWSQDGKQIAFSAIVPDGAWNIYVIASTGGTAQRILPSDQSQVDVNWSPDGHSMVFGSLYVPNMPISIIDLKSKQVSSVPGSNGLFSPHWSPDGRYMSGTTSIGQRLMLFDFSTQKWTKITESSVGYPNWSRDGKYLYFNIYRSLNGPLEVARLRSSDRKIETVAGTSNIGRLTTGAGEGWLGLAPDDSPLLARDISTQEIYALEMEWP